MTVQEVVQSAYRVTQAGVMLTTENATPAQHAVGLIVSLDILFTAPDHAGHHTHPTTEIAEGNRSKSAKKGWRRDDQPDQFQ